MIKSVSAVKAKQLIENNPSLKLIDVREQWEHNKAHILNSQLIPLRELHNHLENLDPKLTYLVYCHHGSRSFYACAFLIQQGFKEVYNLEGGIDAWSRDVDTSIPKY